MLVDVYLCTQFGALALPFVTFRSLVMFYIHNLQNNEKDGTNFRSRKFRGRNFNFTWGQRFTISQTPTPGQPEEKCNEYHEREI